jgi:hypothetical protein
MTITTHEHTETILDTYFIDEVPRYGSIVVNEYSNAKGKIIDFEIRDTDGNPIQDPILEEQVQEFLDEKA